MRKSDKKKKRLLWILGGTLAVASLGIGIWFVSRSGGDPVNVYPFRHLGMTEYWGDSRESYGPVTTDKIQTVFLSDTQSVTEILVKPGDPVKKGDVLMRFDTTLDDLALERKRLDVEKLKLQKQAAQERLEEIREMVPMVIPEETEPEQNPARPDLGTALKGSHKIYASTRYSGMSPETAMICWLKQDAVVSNDLLEQLRQQSVRYRGTQIRTASSASGVVEEEFFEEILEEEFIEDEFFEEIIEEEVLPEIPETEPPEEPELPDEPEVTDPPIVPDPPEEPEETEVPDQPTEGTQPPETQAPELPDVDTRTESFYVVFKITAGNMSLGNREVWQGIQVFGDESSGFAMKFFNALMVPDHSVTVKEEEQEESDVQFDPGSGYTSAQIAEMRSQQEKAIRDLNLKIDMAEAEYKIMEAEMNDGQVYAKIDGEVISVLTEEEARETRHPVLKISGGGGFYVEGSISELEMDGLSAGQEVTINDWNTGMTYTGEVMDLRTFPSKQDNWNGNGNPNVSYYPFRVFVTGDADLQEGSFVSVMYSTASAEHGIYLENAFLRTEQGQHYIWLRGADGKLEKRFVTVGKSLWGNYTEILSGLTEEDFLAFPYGKELKEGAPTAEADISELYSY